MGGETTALHLLARALLSSVGPVETAHALRAEFGWDVAVLTLAELPEAQAAGGLWALAADAAEEPDHPSSSPHAG